MPEVIFHVFGTILYVLFSQKCNNESTMLQYLFKNYTDAIVLFKYYTMVFSFEVYVSFIFPRGMKEN